MPIYPLEVYSQGADVRNSRNSKIDYIKGIIMNIYERHWTANFLAWDSMENEDISLGLRFERAEMEFNLALDALFDAGYEDDFYSYRLGI